MPVQVAPHIYQLHAIGCQVFALLDEQVTLIDAGWPGSGPLVLRQLRQLGRQPADVSRIVLTHYRIDHRGAAAELRRATGAEVFVHVSEAPYLRGQVRYENPVRAQPLAALAAPLLAAARGRPLPVSAIDDQDRLDVLGGLHVLHTPGHTRGSVGLWLPGQGLLFAGDSMGFRRRTLSAPEARVSEDLPRARASLERLAAMDIDTICFSHFPALQHGAKRALEGLVATWSPEFARNGER